jgi:hypothetical protein
MKLHAGILAVGYPLSASSYRLSASALNYGPTAGMADGDGPTARLTADR